MILKGAFSFLPICAKISTEKKANEKRKSPPSDDDFSSESQVKKASMQCIPYGIVNITISSRFLLQYHHPFQKQGSQLFQ